MKSDVWIRKVVGGCKRGDPLIRAYPLSPILWCQSPLGLLASSLSLSNLMTWSLPAQRTPVTMAFRITWNRLSPSCARWAYSSLPGTLPSSAPAWSPSHARQFMHVFSLPVKWKLLGALLGCLLSSCVLGTEGPSRCLSTERLIIASSCLVAMLVPLNGDVPGREFISPCFGFHLPQISNHLCYNSACIIVTR